VIKSLQDTAYDHTNIQDQHMFHLTRNRFLLYLPSLLYCYKMRAYFRVGKERVLNLLAEFITAPSYG